ncbi:MAG TPA: ribonuclease D [Anaeromyxobacteraceae bacterium]|nr:ribonuclease D [Anaeromyxobacteraceae bacterium]
MAGPPPRLHPVLVADGAAVATLAERLAAEAAVALDTESNSFHVYRERVCLLQLSTRDGDWVVDPFAVDPRPLGPALAAVPALVLHGADYDVRCLKREYGWTLPGLFDTMAAARRLGRDGLGLSALVEQHFRVRLSKGFQRSDWGRRPLSAEQVAYAALDTHFLLPLHELLAQELEARDLVAAAREEFARIAAVEPRPKVFDPEGWRRLKGARDLDPRGRAVLRALWVAREERASELDRPPFKVMPEPAMVEVARRRPRSEEDLLRIPGVTPVVLRRLGEVALSAARAADEPDR